MRCFDKFRFQLILTQLSLSLFVTGQVAVNVLCVRLKVWLQYSKLGDQQLSVDEQRHYVEYRTHQQVEAVTQLMISVGFIMLFGSVAPVMVPFTFLVFLIQLRGYAFILTFAGRRTLPREMANFQAWESITHGLMHFSVVLSSIFVVNYGTPWCHKPLLSKLTGCLMVLITSFVLWGMVDLLVPPQSKDAEKETAARSHAVCKIIHACAKAENVIKGDNMTSKIFAAVTATFSHAASTDASADAASKNLQLFQAPADEMRQPRGVELLLAGDWSNVPQVPSVG